MPLALVYSHVLHEVRWFCGIFVWALEFWPPTDSHEFCEFMPLVYLHLFICIHMCYSHVLSGWNALMSVFIYVHVFTCVRMCYSHVLAKRNALMDVLVGNWALNLFLSFTCFTCSAEVGYIKWNAPINASRWMDLFMNNIASFRSLTYAHANFFVNMIASAVGIASLSRLPQFRKYECP